ncbi:MAG: peptidylprolyl isomerase [Euryarchaeota archaeon]|nr:peptidylprolyl isomerase [Euryarchaeota archaeon]
MLSLSGCLERGTGGKNNTTANNTTGGTSSGTSTGGTTTSNITQAQRVCVSTLDATLEAGNVTWVLETTLGTIRVTLYCSKAPLTSQNFVNLTEAGYFDGIKFHRVIEDFMDQGGDPLTKDDSQKARWGTGGPGYTIKDEFYCADGTISYSHPANCKSGLGLKHDVPGILSMANTGRPATGGSQFFLTAVATPHLDGKHAVFGRTADQESTDVVLKINKVATDSNDRPVTPVVINSATIDWT